MRPLLLTFTNLFPSAVMPTHGLFVHERMRRVAAQLDWDWEVVAPVPQVAWYLRAGIYRRWLAVPEREAWQGVAVHHPRYRHWPALSLQRQADAMAAGAAPTVAALVAGRRAVVDAHYLWPDGVAAATLAQRHGLPYVLTARGTDANVVASDRRIARRIAIASATATARFAVSSALAARYTEVAGLAPGQVVVARNGVDLQRYAPGDAAVARTRLGLPAAGRIVLGVGRLVASKGFDVAAQAVAALGGDVRLVLIGEGPERAAIAAAGGGAVRFLGTQPPEMVALAYQAADVLALPSEREGWPNVVTEALAAGLRVVGSRVGGIPEILGEPAAGDFTLGALLPPGDVGAWSAALAAVLARPGDRQRVRAFAERYSWDAPVALLAAVFQAALGQAGRP